MNIVYDDGIFSTPDIFNNAVKESAAACAGLCRQKNKVMSSDPLTQRFEEISEFTMEHGIEPPKISDTVSIKGAIERMCSERWWRPAIRKKWLRIYDQAQREEGLVSNAGSLYVSDRVVAIRRHRKIATRNQLQLVRVSNEVGDEATLAELADASVSNPINRRNELMCRLSGFDKLAEAQGDSGIFLTLSAPGRMHAAMHRSGKVNPKYDGSTPNDVQAYLCNLFAKIRSKLARDGIKIYGFRICEPHHDGTPHWHLLLFVSPERENDLIDVFRHYALQAYPDERGAAKHRFKVEHIDRNKGSAVSYVAKYISKNIDGYGMTESEAGDGATSHVERVDAWASTWGIRQFQQIGGPPVSVWRELRRVKTITGDEHIMWEQWIAAHSNDWNKFCETMGGVYSNRQDMLVSIAKTWSDEPNEYGDPKGNIVDGVQSSGVVLITRQHTWSVVSVGIKAAQSSGTDAARGSAPRLRDGGFCRPWSPINNCTRSNPIVGCDPPVFAMRC